MQLLPFLAVATCASAQMSLWTAYTGWPTCYRQPLLVKTPTALLAIVEGRPGISWCSGTDWPAAPDFPILARSSTDAGETWGSTANITRGNLDFLVAVYDPASASVILLVQQGDTGVIMTRSSDDGATWTPAAPITIDAPAGVFASLIPGVGHGLVISPQYCLDASCGVTAGRIVVPFVATRVGPVSNDTACGTCATALVLSDDGGATWRVGAVSGQNGAREAALVQFDSGDYGVMKGVIYANERNLGNATGSRLHAVSVDGGETFAEYGSDADLPDVVTGNWTGVVAGLARFDRRPAESSYFFTAPAAVGARANLSAWVSADRGASWTARGTIWSGPAAYSDAIQLNSTHVAVVYEAGVTEFAGGIMFSVIEA
jgi:sialidase-1